MHSNGRLVKIGRRMRGYSGARDKYGHWSIARHRLQVLLPFSNQLLIAISTLQEAIRGVHQLDDSSRFECLLVALVKDDSLMVAIIAIDDEEMKTRKMRKTRTETAECIVHCSTAIRRLMIIIAWCVNYILNACEIRVSARPFQKSHANDHCMNASVWESLKQCNLLWPVDRIHKSNIYSNDHGHVKRRIISLCNRCTF